MMTPPTSDELAAALQAALDEIDRHNTDGWYMTKQETKQDLLRLLKRYRERIR